MAVIHQRTAGELFATLIAAPRLGDAHADEVEFSCTSRVPGFVTKAFEIFSDGAHEDVCAWGRDGKTVVVRNISKFELVVSQRRHLTVTWFFFVPPNTIGLVSHGLQIIGHGTSR